MGFFFRDPQRAEASGAVSKQSTSQIAGFADNPRVPSGINIVLVDDHRILRDGLRLVLEKEADFKVIGEAGDVCGALACVRQTAPDLVVLDVQLPDGNGLDAARQMLSFQPGIRILMLSGDPDQRFVNEAMRLGISGYLLKDEASQELVRAVRLVMSGKVYLCPASATALVHQFRVNPEGSAASAKAQLSEREAEVLQLVVEGLRNKEIADRLGISVKSVESYRARLMVKAACSSPAELVRYAIKEGLASL